MYFSGLMFYLSKFTALRSVFIKIRVVNTASKAQAVHDQQYVLPCERHYWWLKKSVLQKSGWISSKNIRATSELIKSYLKKWFMRCWIFRRYWSPPLIFWSNEFFAHHMNFLPPENKLQKGDKVFICYCIVHKIDMIWCNKF